MNVVISYFKEKYDELYLIGHSFGCLPIMNSKLDSITKIIYWEPTYGIKSLEEKNITYDENKDKYILHWGFESIVSKELVEEWLEISNIKNYFERLTGNCSFIFAENTKKYDFWKNYIKGYEYIIIEGASHRFIEEGTLKILFEETLKLLEK